MSDEMLFAYVNQMLNSGARDIVIPASLLQSASEEAIEELRRLCAINRVNVSVDGSE
jgi:hypothetical protein